jgi:AhpD family alkylhydroperoxidase
MKSSDMIDYRQKYNELLVDTDLFFKEFGSLDDNVYSDGAISKKNKELMGLAISVVSRCNECILYHINESHNVGANKDEIIEAIKIGVIGGGSITYPNVRFAFEMLRELGILKP